MSNEAAAEAGLLLMLAGFVGSVVAVELVPHHGTGLATLGPILVAGIGGGLVIRPHVDARTYNMLLRGLRCLGERGFAVLTERWKALKHITMSPRTITVIARAALALTHFEYGLTC